ncbi:MAG: pyridoxamine 5'-phosphate oxidase family protein [Firmicutes bacterium]|nr:pyridoxamine 5'-phosphate oxidase family protein [Bacillota bacterium]
MAVIAYEPLEKEIIAALEKNALWVLSTASGGYVTSRTMSIVHIGLTVYFQSNQCYTKHAQITANPRAALCYGSISIEGGVKALGPWGTMADSRVEALYRTRHPGPFEAYGHLAGQTVYEFTPTLVKLWKYEKTPFREILHADAGTAERLAFM